MTTTVQPVVPAQRAGAVTRPNQYPGNCVDCGQLVESAPRATEAGTVIPFELVFRPRAIYDLAAAERMPLAEAEAITARYGRCIVCATPLKAAGSVKRGIGPVCRKLFASDAEER